MSTLVGATRAVPWGYTLQGKEKHAAAGSRDVLFISQDEAVQGEGIVPRRQAELTSDDKRELEKLDLPPDQWDDDATILATRNSKDTRFSAMEVMKRMPGQSLTAKKVMKKIEVMMNNTQTEGVAVTYFGPGKRNTGDWCFEDGFITFRDIAELYMNHFRGRVLGINSDCSYAGQWVKQLQAFLDEQGVQPCGHSARDKGVMIKMSASCQSNEVPYRLLYSIRAIRNDKNNGTAFIQGSEFEVAQAQHIKRIDSTVISCKNKSIAELCTLKLGYTWHKWSASKRIFKVRGEDQGRQAWHYVLLVDDQETIDTFKELTMGDNTGKGTIDVSDYGQVLKSGWGDEPPKDIQEWIENYEAPEQ